MLDAVVIENSSEESIRLDDFLGVSSDSQGLRPLSEAGISADQRNSALGLSARTLRPREKIVLPLRIVFGHGQNSWDIDDAMEGYHEIRASKEKVVTFDLQTVSPDGKRMVTVGTVRKTISSFGQPKAPLVRDYEYGPRTMLSGLVVGGRQILFDLAADSSGPSSPEQNDVKLSVFRESDARSCPVLLSWDESTQSWVNVGKVLHDAQGASKEMTEHIRLRTFQTRFRLEELEPEVSYIKDVRLVITLKDGRHVELVPKEAGAHTLPAYSSVDIDFDPPSDVSENEVKSSEIAITGYYQRYDSLLSAGDATTK